jgi:hypothetical protein
MFLAILALSVMSVSVWAKNDSSDSVTTNIRLTAASTVAGTKLAPGEYKVVAEGSKAKFEQRSKVVAEVPCTLKDNSTKVSQTTFVLNGDTLTEIQVAGKSKSIDFGGN